MPAIIVQESGNRGDWHSLTLAHIARPVVQKKQVLVQVEACSVNRADLLQRRGLYPPPPHASPLLGLDFAGFVTSAGAKVSNRHVGDRVFGITAGGGYGRYLAVAADHLIAIPENLSFIEAAAAAEVFFTAFVNLFVEAEMQPKELLLLHGGGSGVGTAAIQLARAFAVRTIVTASSDDTLDACLKLGARHGINYRQHDFAEQVLALTNGQGVDAVLDFIGAPYLSRHLDLLRLQGRLILIGLMGGAAAEIQLGPVLNKRLRIIGSVLRSRSAEEKAMLTHAFTEQVRPLLASGEVRPIIDRIYPIQQVEEAHRYMLEGRRFGKIVLTWQEVG